MKVKKVSKVRKFLHIRSLVKYGSWVKMELLVKTFLKIVPGKCQIVPGSTSNFLVWFLVIGRFLAFKYLQLLVHGLVTWF